MQFSEIVLTSKPTKNRNIEIVGQEHVVEIDTAVAHGGTNKAANPIEVLLSALIGCYNQQLRKLAVEQGIEIESTLFAVKAKFDRRAVTFDEEVDVPFPKVVIDIELSSAADEAVFVPIKNRLKHRCAVSKLLLNSSCDIQENWRICSSDAVLSMHPNQLTEDSQS